MRRQIFSMVMSLILLPGLLFADDSLWIQIEAQPSLLEAEDRARAYSVRLPNVHAFSLGSGWYAVAIGPYTQDEVEAEYQDLRNRLEVPFDSFIATGDNYRQKVWPIGSETALEFGTSTQTNSFSRSTAEIETFEPSLLDRSEDETSQEALLSEDALNREAKKELQRALQWAEYYESSIDGMFGAGTRTSMRAWQEANQFPATGILTTLQREVLLKQYDQILLDLGIEQITDLQTGVILNLPMGVLEFAEYDPPLAHFAAVDGGAQAAYVISQKGDKNSLRTLYRGLQTLKILPPKGPRKLSTNGFRITGKNSQITSVAEAFLSQGEIKGYILVWPTSDDNRRRRLLNNMQTSFEVIPGVLQPKNTTADAQEIDALFGLGLRQPFSTRSGFFATSEGHVVTDAKGLEQCDEITIRPNYQAKVLPYDQNQKFAILMPETRLVPPVVAQLARNPLNRGDDVVSAGYSYMGKLDFPSVTKGTIDEMRGLDGREDVVRLSIPAMKGDIGGPVLNQAGSVTGMLLDSTSGARSLPENVHMALKSSEIAEQMARLGILVQTNSDKQPVEDLLLAKRARSITALVSCWKN